MPENKEIKSIAFTMQADPKHRLTLTFSDYKSISEDNGYYHEYGIFRRMGYSYDFRPFLKQFWYKNYGKIESGYATSKTDLKRVIRAHYGSISQNFKAVEVK